MQDDSAPHQARFQPPDSRGRSLGFSRRNSKADNDVGDDRGHITGVNSLDSRHPEGVSRLGALTERIAHGAVTVIGVPA